MKCLRCGYCCKWLSVMVVDDPEKGVVEDNLTHHNGQGQPCKHLRGDKRGEYSCAVHDRPWYKETPCAEHTQVESSPDDECRMGRFLLDHPSVLSGDAPIIDGMLRLAGFPEGVGYLKE